MDQDLEYEKLKKKEEQKAQREEMKARKLVQRKAYKLNGFEGMTDYEILSLFLGFTPGIKDPFEAAKYLLSYFGTFNNIFNASTELLLDIPFMDDNAVLLIKSVPEVCRRNAINAFPKNKRIKTPEIAKEFLRPYFIGYDMEKVFLLLLNNKYLPIETVCLATGNSQSVLFSPEVVLRTALFGKAAHCIIAHSHPGGFAEPSREDNVATIKISNDLSICKISLLDHLIFSKDDCFCMSSSEEFDKSILAFSKFDP